jgi:membrane protein YqaA with SNARE-associated domain
MESNLHNFLVWISLPVIGLPAIFIFAFVSATLLPLASEPALFAYVKLNPEMIWIAIVVATLGNVLGGMVDWFMGYGAHKAHDKFMGSRNYGLLRWFEKLGPKALLFAWLPIVGDPLCALAGWLKHPWMQCLLYMTIGKFLRYITMTYLLLAIPEGFWAGIYLWAKTILQAWFP